MSSDGDASARDCCYRPGTMPLWARRLFPLVVAAICAVAAATALAGNHREPLAGTWSGAISGHAGSGIRGARIVIVVNARETGGSWSLSATCHGPLAPTM